VGNTKNLMGEMPSDSCQVLLLVEI
jgi:hypothetical protein